MAKQFEESEVTEKEEPTQSGEGTDDTAAEVAEVETEASAEAPADVEAPPVEEFKPSYKFKAYRKEYEVDDWAKPLITKETQEKLLPVFSGWKATEEMKQELQQSQGRLKEIEPELQDYSKRFSRLEKMVKSKDVFGLAEYLGLPKEAIADAIVAEHEKAQLPEHVRRKMEADEATSRRAMTLEEENEFLRKQNSETLQSSHQREVETALNDPSVKPVQEQYDARMGRAGAFTELMEDIGFNHFLRTGGNPDTQRGGVHLPAHVVAQRAITMLGMTPSALEDPVTPTTPVTTAQKAAVPAPMPVIGKGSARAPGKKVVSSMAELRQKARDFAQAGT